MFLEEFANETGGTAELDEYPAHQWPLYKVCSEEAHRLAGGDTDLAELILDGHVPLHQMPKDLWDFRARERRLEWLRTKAEEYRTWLSEIARKAMEASA
jgi:hypothetical protein